MASILMVLLHLPDVQSLRLDTTLKSRVQLRGQGRAVLVHPLGMMLPDKGRDCVVVVGFLHLLIYLGES